MRAYAEQLRPAYIECVNAMNLLVTGTPAFEHVRKAVTLLYDLNERAAIPAAAICAPCNEQCEPNGCAECPVAPSRHQRNPHPLVNVTDDGDLCIEWWKGDRKVTCYAKPDYPCILVKDDGKAWETSETLDKCLAWLAEAPCGNRIGVPSEEPRNG